MKITLKNLLLLFVLSATTWGSNATAILKTTSASYTSILGAQFHDGESRRVTSQGDLFYDSSANKGFRNQRQFDKKYQDNNGYDDSYSHAPFLSVGATDNQLSFLVGQEASPSGPDISRGNRFAFQDFSFNWQFDVIGDDALMAITLLAGTGSSIFSLTDLSLNQTFTSSAIDYFQQDLLLTQGHRYLFSLNMSNKSFSDGIPAEAYLRLSNATFPVPAPNNTSIILSAIAMLMIRNKVKRTPCHGAS